MLTRTPTPRVAVKTPLAPRVALASLSETELAAHKHKIRKKFDDKRTRQLREMSKDDPYKIKRRD